MRNLHGISRKETKKGQEKKKRRGTIAPSLDIDSLKAMIYHTVEVSVLLMLMLSPALPASRLDCNAIDATVTLG